MSAQGRSRVKSKSVTPPPKILYKMKTHKGLLNRRGRRDGRMDGWIVSKMDRWMDGWVDGWLFRRMDGWMDIGNGVKFINTKKQAEQ